MTKHAEPAPLDALRAAAASPPPWPKVADQLGFTSSAAARIRAVRAGLPIAPRKTGRPVVWTPERIAEAEAALARLGTWEKVGAAWSMSAKAIAVAVNRHRRAQGKPSRRTARPRVWTPERIAALHAEYAQHGSWAAVARANGIRPDTLYAAMSKASGRKIAA